MNINTAPPYTQVQHVSVNLGGEQLELVTKPGLPDWKTYSPSTSLFIENSSIQPNDSVLLYGRHLGLLAGYLTRRYPDIHVTITDHLHTSLEMSRRTLEVNQAGSVDIVADISIPDHLVNSFSTVYIQIPKGRLLARRWLMQAHQALIEGGSLYLGGSNKAGVQSAISDAGELFGKSSVLAYKRGNRVALFMKTTSLIPDVGWTKLPGIAPATWFEFSVKLFDRTIPIRSLPGVFSYDHLDEGTQMLLSVCTVPPGSRVLDVGCGYGVIGLYASKQGASCVHMVDDDLLATASCKATLALNGTANAEVFSGDLLDPVISNRYDLILSNPPFHSGHLVDFQVAEAMIAQSYQALVPGGRLTIVSNRFIRYDYLIKAIFGNVSLLAQSGKFHVLSGLKSG